MRISKTMVTAIIGVLFSFCAIDCIGTDIKAKNGQWRGNHQCPSSWKTEK